MRKALIYLILPLLLAFCADADAQTESFLRQHPQRDSILIGDHLEYGFRLEGIEDGTVLGFPKLEESTFVLVEDWTEKILKTRSQGEGLPDLLDIEASIKVAAFDEGVYELPPIVIGRATPDGKVDTLIFDPIKVEIKTVQIDTTSFQPHPMGGVIQTPFNWEEFIFTTKEIWSNYIALLPTLLIIKWVIMLIIVGICIWMIYERKNKVQSGSEALASEPAHIVALRKLDAFRSNAMWVPEKQKAFYSGVTDALREYISRRYGIGAMEMTTAELFQAVKTVEGFPTDMMDELKGLFETADFVKFAKFVASDEDNASAVPKAVRFVMQTYQSELDKIAQAAGEQEVMKK